MLEASVDQALMLMMSWSCPVGLDTQGIKSRGVYETPGGTILR